MKALLLPNRLDRIPYIIRMILMQAVLFVLMKGIQNNEGNPTSYVLLVVLLTLYVYMVWFICIPRCRDAGFNPWTLLIFFIPYANIAYGIILAFIKSKEEREKENQRFEERNHTGANQS